MGKYIIDVKDKETLYKAVIAPDGEPYITSAMGNVYTEPDTEKIRKEAYSKGFDDGRNECASREICMNQSYQHGYETGLDDGKRIEREDIFKTIEKFADDDVDYDNITIADFKIIMEITKRLQKIK